MELIVIFIETEETNCVYCGKVCSSEIRNIRPIYGLPSITSLMKKEFLLRYKIKKLFINFMSEFRMS